MEHEATINARLPQALKRGGGRVLEKNGVSTTQVIHRLYRYMEREGRIPECLDEEAAAVPDVFARRRELARSISGSIHLESGLDIKKERAERIEAKYGDLL